MVTGLPPLPLLQTSCEPCIMGKQHRTPIPKTSETIVSNLLQLVHSDLCGPLPQPSMTRSRYIFTFIDHFSRYTWVYFLNAKSETFHTFKIWHTQVEKETNKTLSLPMHRQGWRIPIARIPSLLQGPRHPSPTNSNQHPSTKRRGRKKKSLPSGNYTKSAIWSSTTYLPLGRSCQDGLLSLQSCANPSFIPHYSIRSLYMSASQPYPSLNFQQCCLHTCSTQKKVRSQIASPCTYWL